MKVLIIGGGFFGTSIAIKIKENFKNSKITLCEKKEDLFLGASGKNQFRCHLGYHYPRSDQTIQECKDSFLDFDKYYNDTYLKTENYYAISKKNSKTNFDDYLSALDKNNLKYKISKHNLLNPKLIEGSIHVNEKIISINLARKKVWKILKSLNVDVRLNTEVSLNQKNLKNYDHVILCTYDKNNENLENINSIEKNKYYYQLVEKIIVKPPKIFQNKSFVILDGPFMCIDPYEKKNYSILGSVENSVIAKVNSRIHNFDYLKNLEEYLSIKKDLDVFLGIKKDFEKFFLNFEKTKYFKSFFVVRTTKKNKKDDRITEIQQNKKIITVFSGKWVNCITSANKIIKILK